MSSEKYDIPTEWKKSAWINPEKREQLYTQSVEDKEKFWSSQAERLVWTKKFTQVKNTSFNSPVTIEWFKDGELNVCYNCVDRHLPQKANDVAFFWEPDSPDSQSKSITFKQLHKEVCRWANLLKAQGVKKGDRVTLYLPMIPEAVYTMLACARIGAIHSVVFAGFSPEALSDRLNGCESSLIITADEGRRGGKTIPLKSNVDQALKNSPQVKKVILVKNTGASVAINKEMDIWAEENLKAQSDDCPVESFNAETPLFILYTSGSTNKPKGVLHTSAGYLLYASLTHQWVFDYHPEDIYWCAADVGWITGHSYMVYGPLANGATSVLFEGVPTYPDASRLWQVVDKYKVSTLYTAPTLIRALLSQGNDFVKHTSRKSLRLLGSVGEPINPEAWQWYYEVAGEKRCPIVDTWWQTETGGIMITPLPGATELKPGSASFPFFGVEPEIKDEKGETLEGEAQGVLCIKDSWPGQARTVYKDHERFEQTYFSQYPGYYFTGDGCRRDKDGFYWITGRVDDVLNVSGHRMGTAEIESALVEHELVAESAVVGFPHSVKGQGIYCYVTLVSGAQGDEKLKKELLELVKKEIGPFAKPDLIQWAPALPKTRSGKIMRRILRKIAENQLDSMGDTSTLADPQVVEDLIRNRQTFDGH